MKTAELIRQLREADPGGELECVVGSHDIDFVYALPPYWDGCHEVLIRDEAGTGYNIVGGEIRCSGPDKVVIRTLSLEWAILDDADLPVACPERYAATVERWREEAREIDREIAEERAKREATSPGSG